MKYIDNLRGADLFNSRAARRDSKVARHWSVHGDAPTRESRRVWGKDYVAMFHIVDWMGGLEGKGKDKGLGLLVGVGLK